MLRIRTSTVCLWHPRGRSALLGTSNNQTTTLSMTLQTKESAGQRLHAEIFILFQIVGFDRHMTTHIHLLHQVSGERKIKTTCWENRAVGWVCIIDQSLDVWMCRCMAFKSDKNVNNPRDSIPTNRNTSNIILWQRMAPTIYGQHELIIWFSFANLMFSFISRL